MLQANLCLIRYPEGFPQSVAHQSWPMYPFPTLSALHCTTMSAAQSQEQKAAVDGDFLPVHATRLFQCCTASHFCVLLFLRHHVNAISTALVIDKATASWPCEDTERRGNTGSEAGEGVRRNELSRVR